MARPRDARIFCQQCGRQYRWNPHLMGRLVRCACGVALRVPTQADFIVGEAEPGDAGAAAASAFGPMAIGSITGLQPPTPAAGSPPASTGSGASGGAGSSGGGDMLTAPIVFDDDDDAEELEMLPEAAILDDAETPLSPLPEAAIPEATLPEATLPEATLPDATIPEAPFPEAEQAPPPSATGSSSEPASPGNPTAPRATPASASYPAASEGHALSPATGATQGDAPPADDLLAMPELPELPSAPVLASDPAPDAAADPHPAPTQQAESSPAPFSLSEGLPGLVEDDDSRPPSPSGSPRRHAGPVSADVREVELKMEDLQLAEDTPPPPTAPPAPPVTAAVPPPPPEDAGISPLDFAIARNKEDAAKDDGDESYELAFEGDENNPLNAPPASVPAHGGRCPSCGVPLKATAVVCMNCGFNIREGQRLNTQIAAAAEGGPPGMPGGGPPVATPDTPMLPGRTISPVQRALLEREDEPDHNVKELKVPFAIIVVGAVLVLMNAFVFPAYKFIGFETDDISLMRLGVFVGSVVWLFVQIPFIFVGIIIIAKLFGTDFGQVGPFLLKMLALALAMNGVSACMTTGLNVMTEGNAWLGWSLALAADLLAFMILASVLFDLDIDEQITLFLFLHFAPMLTFVFLGGLIYSMVG